MSEVGSSQENSRVCRRLIRGSAAGELGVGDGGGRRGGGGGDEGGGHAELNLLVFTI